MRKFIYSLFMHLSYKFKDFAGEIYKPEEPVTEHMRWNRDDGDKTLRLNYDLNDKSIVFDIGGYEGQWTSDIYSKYNCNIYVFEPVNKFYLNIKNRFSKNNKIIAYHFGISNKNTKSKISVMDDRSSIMKASENMEEVEVRDIFEVFNELGINRIDLLKMNIEGGEYEVIERLIDTGLINKIGNLQVQFHDFIPDCISRKEKINISLAKTHRLTYKYDFIWENWSLI